jgi:hypothetical protein
MPATDRQRCRSQQAAKIAWRRRSRRYRHAHTGRACHEFGGQGQAGSWHVTFSPRTAGPTPSAPPRSAKPQSGYSTLLRPGGAGKGTGEQSLARGLYRRLEEDWLLIADRNFL